MNVDPLPKTPGAEPYRERQVLWFARGLLEFAISRGTSNEGLIQTIGGISADFAMSGLHRVSLGQSTPVARTKPISPRFPAAWSPRLGPTAIESEIVTLGSGRYAGQLGPWSRVVSAVGIEPRSTLMKSIFLIFGLAWLGIMVCFGLALEWAWWRMLICAIAASWYLPFGTLLSLIQIVLLLLPPLRGSGGPV